MVESFIKEVGPERNKNTRGTIFITNASEMGPPTVTYQPHYPSSAQACHSYVDHKRKMAIFFTELRHYPNLKYFGIFFSLTSSAYTSRYLVLGYTSEHETLTMP